MNLLEAVGRFNVEITGQLRVPRTDVDEVVEDIRHGEIRIAGIKLLTPGVTVRSIRHGDKETLIFVTLHGAFSSIGTIHDIKRMPVTIENRKVAVANFRIIPNPNAVQGNLWNDERASA